MFIFICTLRSILATFLFLIWTIFLCILAIVNAVIFRNRKYEDGIVIIWARLTCWFYNIEIVTHGLESIPHKGSIFLFNHTSFFDIFSLAAVVPGLRFGAKIELFKIPIFGAAIRRTGTLPIARSNRQEVFKVYEEAKVRIAAGERFALSPEGGRFYGQELSPFKSGPFIFAINSSAMLVPTVIVGAYECLPKGEFLANRTAWKRKIDVYFLEPVTTVGYNNENRQDLQAHIYQSMNSIWTCKKN